MAEGRHAAAIDLVGRLSSAGLGPIFVLAGRSQDPSAIREAGAEILPADPGPFHFGQTLSSWVDRLGLESFGYFGGASAPLVQAELLRACVERLRAAEPAASALVNNLHSTDWGFFRGAGAIRRLAHRLPSDNSLGWVLEQEGGVAVASLPASAETRADLDTPSDFLLVEGHEGLGGHLRAFVAGAPNEARQRVRRLEQTMRTPGSTLTLIGRTSSYVWAELEKRRSIWIRVFAEERGMVASGRLAAGRVQSLLAQALDAWGPRGLLERLVRMSDAVLWDTRVWMATGSWPSEADRFAADLGWAESVSDPRLRELVDACQAAAIPVICGGHGVVGGSLYAVLERLAPNPAV
jgi:CTP:molybdopterin cytidylyltransferase MocA